MKISRIKSVFIKHILLPLNETDLMIGHKICFNGEILMIIPKISVIPLLICSTDNCHEFIIKTQSCMEL